MTTSSHRKQAFRFPPAQLLEQGIKFCPAQPRSFGDKKSAFELCSNALGHFPGACFERLSNRQPRAEMAGRLRGRSVFGWVSFHRFREKIERSLSSCAQFCFFTGFQFHTDRAPSNRPAICPYKVQGSFASRTKYSDTNRRGNRIVNASFGFGGIKQHSIDATDGPIPSKKNSVAWKASSPKSQNITGLSRLETSSSITMPKKRPCVNDRDSRNKTVAAISAINAAGIKTAQRSSFLKKSNGVNRQMASRWGHRPGHPELFYGAGSSIGRQPRWGLSPR